MGRGRETRMAAKPTELRGYFGVSRSQMQGKPWLSCDESAGAERVGSLDQGSQGSGISLSKEKPDTPSALLNPLIVESRVSTWAAAPSMSGLSQGASNRMTVRDDVPAFSASRSWVNPPSLRSFRSFSGSTTSTGVSIPAIYDIHCRGTRQKVTRDSYFP